MHSPHSHGPREAQSNAAQWGGTPIEAFSVGTLAASVAEQRASCVPEQPRETAGNAWRGAAERFSAAVLLDISQLCSQLVPASARQHGVIRRVTSVSTQTTSSTASSHQEMDGAQCHGQVVVYLQLNRASCLHHEASQGNFRDHCSTN